MRIGRNADPFFNQKSDEKLKLLYPNIICTVYHIIQLSKRPETNASTGQDSGVNTIDGTKSQNSDADTAIAPGRPPEDNNK